MAKSSRLIKVRDNSIQRLCRQKEYFKKFDSVDDWVVKEDENVVEREGEYFSHIKNYIITKYKAQDIYLSSAVVDDIIFYCLQNSEIANFVNDVEDLIERSGLTKNSIVIFPLHDFGFQYAGLGNLINHSHVSLKYDNFQVNSQSNSFNKTVSNITDYLEQIKFPKRKKLDLDLFRHYYVSRNLKWFERNPLIFFHFKFSQVERYDNVAFILEKMSFITNKLYFLYTLRSEKDKVGSLFSTTNSNNWETLDINHFLTISRTGANNQINCIPVHYKYSLLYEDMHMKIDLKAKKKAVYQWEAKAISCIDLLYDGYRNYLLTKDKKYGMYYRIASSLSYFRRSVKSVRREDKVININIAFETLLLDKQETQKRAKMLERIWKVLKGKINKKTNLKNIENAIEDRNLIIHNGLPASIDVDFIDVYRTYCRLILFLSDNISSISATQPNYLTQFYSTY